MQIAGFNATGTKQKQNGSGIKSKLFRNKTQLTELSSSSSPTSSMIMKEEKFQSWSYEHVALPRHTSLGWLGNKWWHGLSQFWKYPFDSRWARFALCTQQTKSKVHIAGKRIEIVWCRNNWRKVLEKVQQNWVEKIFKLSMWYMLKVWYTSV